MNKEQLKQLEADLWRAADNLRANSDLKASEYSTPVLGLIFLKFADNNYRHHETAILAEYQRLQGTRREKSLAEIAIEKCGFYLPDYARYDHLLNLPEKEDIAKAIKEAMKAIEQYKPELQGILPQDEYFRLTRTNPMIPTQLLKTFADIPADAGGDLFGQIYEYFLGEFAMSEGQGGGEFFTPRSVVQLMVTILAPERGSVFDPACGSGGMFVQSAHFIEQHRQHAANSAPGDLYVYGQEKTLETVKLAKMNLAVNGLRGEIRQCNTYYEDPYGSLGKFDYVLANPPFNVDDVSLSSVEKDPRFNTYGVPRNKSKEKKADQGKETVPNGNYLWINLFATSLKPNGRAALVMANSASDARHSEAEIRQKLIEENLIDSMVTLPSNMFYTVTLPATLWFFDKAKTDDRILFIDARNIFTQIDRAHREFSEEQIQNIAIISQLRKGQRANFVALIDRYFAQGMAKLVESSANVESVTEQLRAIFVDATENANAQTEAAVTAFVDQWTTLQELQHHYTQYLSATAPVISTASPVISTTSPVISTEGRNLHLTTRNTAQHHLRAAFDPFFAALHEHLKTLDKLVRHQEKVAADLAKADGKRAPIDRKRKALQSGLAALHAEVKNAERYFHHIAWLQARFPNAAYEDVTGLCKLATLAEVQEQEYSLNPGRYVGVVIEEDGKTEEEFIEEIVNMNNELAMLNLSARTLEEIITRNVNLLVGDL